MLGSHCRAIHYECQDWPYNLLRMHSNHDLSISGVMISHDLISHSDTITYVPIGLLRLSLRLGLDLT